jgi:phage gp36-like protein
MQYDLHFTETPRGVNVRALTRGAVEFLNGEYADDETGYNYETTITYARQVYEAATELGLHVAFETVELRDLLAAVR